MAGKTWLLMFGAAVFALGLPTWANARGGGGFHGGAPPPPMNPGGNPGGGGNEDWGGKGAGFIVIQAGDTDGNVTFDAIRVNELKVRQEQLPAAYRDAVKEWTHQKSEAEKAGEKFAKFKPVIPFVQDYMDKVYVNPTVAKSVAKKCQEDWDKELPKKGNKEGDAKGTDGKAGAAPKDEKAVADPKPAE